MTGYPQEEGKHGSIYQIANGISVTPDGRGTWLLIIRRGTVRTKRSFGKSEEDRRQAIKAAELLGTRLGLTLEKQVTDRTFGMVAEEYLLLNAGRWQPGTRERYHCIVRDHLRPLHQIPLGEGPGKEVTRGSTEDPGPENGGGYPRGD